MYINLILKLNSILSSAFYEEAALSNNRRCKKNFFFAFCCHQPLDKLKNYGKMPFSFNNKLQLLKMTNLTKSYSPEIVEDKWYNAWLSNHCFKANASSPKEPYCIMIPPPNVTGVLTMGHVLNNTIQDILVRRARQAGKEVLWLPGTDHAGIATQTRVERELRKEGLTRYDLGREKFIERTKKWRDDHGGIILQQLKRLGASCDWDRLVHTLDDDYSNAVLTAFVELFKRGYIYRGKRMVNWCPVSLTALSDEEVIMKPQKSFIYKIRYELVDDAGHYLEISTTRPETIMGDTAVAVNPNDDRYKKLIGKQVWRPFPKVKLPIIADEAVDIDFGTGVLKVTPAHDPADFAIGARHNLPIVDIMHPNGILNDLAGTEFAGMERFKARKAVVKKLEELDLLIEEKPYDNNIGYSERTDVPIEPRVSEQWFLKYPKIEEAKKAVQEGVIKFWPKRWEKTYLHWLANIQDWCISRQLWWGHRIPVWYKKGKDRNDPLNWYVSLTAPPDPENWEQEEDVLDTWASAWLWPFATLGWPNENAMNHKGFYKFYPTNDLITGPDIIFFWVARMIIAGLEFTGPEKEKLETDEIPDRIPFANVYFTGIVRDLQGRKMSKSLGNSPDPIELIDKYGADGLRLGIISIAAQGQDIHFSEERVQFGRNFCNKLWNVCRFRMISGEVSDNSSLDHIIKRMNFEAFDADDHAILDALIKTIDNVRNAFSLYEFNSVVQYLYNFFWAHFCDWYIEVSKTKHQDGAIRKDRLAIQDLIIREVLLMLHPFIPFITEELWHELKYGKANEFIQNTPLSESKNVIDYLDRYGITISEQAVEEVSKIRELITKGRALKAEFQLAAKKDLTFYYQCDEEQQYILENHTDKIKLLLGAGIFERTQKLENTPGIVTPLGTLFLNVTNTIDVEIERDRLSKEILKLEKLIELGQSKLQNEEFKNKAPPSIIEGARKQLKENEEKHIEMKRLLNGL